MPVPASIADGPRELQAAYERGLTVRQIAPRSELTRGYAQLIDVVAGEDQDADRRKRAFFGFFR